MNLVDDVILPHVSDWLAVDTLQVAKDHMELILEFSDSQLRDIMILAPRVYCESSYHSCFFLILCVRLIHTDHLRLFLIHYIRVPTRTGKPGKMGRHFLVREKSRNFEQTRKVTQNHTKYWKTQGI